MAKRIKVIECPKCGSTKKTELKTDYFRCDNCNTEYFLDNDDVNINHNVNYSNPQNFAPYSLSGKTRRIIYASVILLIVAIFFLLKLPSRNFVSSPLKTIIQAEERWSRSDKITFVNQKGEGMVLIVGEKYSYNSEDKSNDDKFVAAVYDSSTGKLAKSIPLQGVLATATSDFQIRSFSNGELYFVVNKNQVFKFDSATYSVTDVTTNLFKGNADFSAGIANIEFVYDNYGDGFNLLTNDGNNLYFYPIVDKVYKKNEFYDASHGMKSVLSVAKDKQAFTISRINSSFPNEKIHLVKYTYKDNGGGPKDDVTFEWREDYGGNSGLTDKKVFLTTFKKNNSRIVSFEIMSPDRLLFKPKVLCFDKDFLLISFNKTAAEESPTSIQCINAQTGEIIFTTPLADNQTFRSAVHYKDGFVVAAYNEFFNIDAKGKIVKQFKLG